MSDDCLGDHRSARTTGAARARRHVILRSRMDDAPPSPVSVMSLWTCLVAISIATAIGRS
jgi:hypothetical protein